MHSNKAVNMMCGLVSKGPAKNVLQLASLKADHGHPTARQAKRQRRRQAAELHKALPPIKHRQIPQPEYLLAQVCKETLAKLPSQHLGRGRPHRLPCNKLVNVRRLAHLLQRTYPQLLELSEMHSQSQTRPAKISRTPKPDQFLQAATNLVRCSCFTAYVCIIIIFYIHP